MFATHELVIVSVAFKEPDLISEQQEPAPVLETFLFYFLHFYA